MWTRNRTDEKQKVTMDQGKRHKRMRSVVGGGTGVGARAGNKTIEDKC